MSKELPLWMENADVCHHITPDNAGEIDIDRCMVIEIAIGVGS